MTYVIIFFSIPSFSYCIAYYVAKLKLNASAGGSSCCELHKKFFVSLTAPVMLLLGDAFGVLPFTGDETDAVRKTLFK